MFFFSSPSFLLFCCSSTFKDAERASLRDSGHGDSDQADSDQDTNKGSHCDTSAREALKMKATAVNGQPFEQGEWMHSFPDILKMPMAVNCVNKRWTMSGTLVPNIAHSLLTGNMGARVFK